jgi:hypothetical protein
MSSFTPPSRSFPFTSSSPIAASGLIIGDQIIVDRLPGRRPCPSIVCMSAVLYLPCRDMMPNQGVSRTSYFNDTSPATCVPVWLLPCFQVSLRIHRCLLQTPIKWLQWFMTPNNSDSYPKVGVQMALLKTTTPPATRQPDFCDSKKATLTPWPGWSTISDLRRGLPPSTSAMWLSTLSNFWNIRVKT